MAMTANYNGNLNRYKYEIILKCLATKDSDEFIEIQRNLRDFTVFNLYDENVFPIYQFDFVFDKTTLRLIQDNAETIVFILSVKKYEIEPGNDSVSVTSDSNRYLIRDLVLKPYDIERTVLPITDDVNDDRGTTARNKNFRMVIPCLAYDHVQMNKGINSAVFNSAKLKDIILFFLNKYRIRNVLMSPPDNDKILEQILVPPLNMTNAIEFFQEIYGIYESGMRLFFDHNYSYILNKDFIKPVPTPPAGSKEWDTVFIELTDERLSTQDVYGYYEDWDNEIHRIKLVDETKIVTRDATTREIGGELIKFMSRTKENRNIQRIHDLNFGPTNLNPEAQNGDTRKEAIRWNNYSNPYIESQYRSEMSRNMLRLQMPWENIDPEVFMYSRKYRIEFANDSYKDYYSGLYQISSMVYKFNKAQQDKYYSIVGQSSFNKIHDQFKR
jgi:hypothetical protein